MTLFMEFKCKLQKADGPKGWEEGLENTFVGDGNVQHLDIDGS